MAFKEIFPTTISQGSLEKSQSLRKNLLKDIELISKEDKLGREWSKTNYIGGYTSYASLNNLQHRYPSFMEFEKLMAKQAYAFAKELGWNLKGLELQMTDCWANIMPQGTYHTLHFHPHSVISGAFYVTTPPGSVALKLEDPRMSFFMNAPQGKSMYAEIPAEEGKFVLFESWLRHEVPPNHSKKPRVSISFNYAL
ncbi:MAG: TIGR02466 family protein [Pseudomonadota bacterium]